jgi:hypothetical protein
MNKSLIASLSVACMLYLGCSKSKQPGPQNTTDNAIKITLVSGSGQTDTVGQTLLSPIVVKVTQNGAPVSGYTVQFTGSGCNSDRADLLNTKSDGTASYNWSLAGDIGLQTLKAYAVNAQNVKVDSIAATGTGVAPGLGWETSACSLQEDVMPSSMCKLSTGRLFACYSSLELRYSDDNGISWNLVSSFGKTNSPEFVVSTPADGLFVFSTSDVISYSADAGATWSVVGKPAIGTITSAICTPSGRLFVTDPETVAVSSDNGKTWITPAASFNDSQMGSPTEDKNGNLYVAGGETQTIYKSADGGATWTPVADPPREDVGLYVDNNNTFYKSTSISGVYISKDNGATYSLLISSPNSFITAMSVQSDGNFYYDNPGKGLYQLVGSNPPRHLDDNESSIPTVYILAKNNNIVFSSFSPVINYYRL